MFNNAKVKLVLLFTGVFLLLFALFSLGIFGWMKSSLGEGYITQVRQKNLGEENGFSEQQTTIVTTAGDVALIRLRFVLLVLNGVLLFMIPLIGLVLTERVLDPIQKSHDQQRQFVSDASHELRSPLAIISGQVEVALKKDREDVYYRRVLKSVKEEADRLTGLVQNLLFLARREQNKLTIKFIPVDLVDVVLQVIAKKRREAKRKGINLIFNPPADPVSVMGDGSLLTQLLLNLVSNSIVYTGKGGEVEVKLISFRRLARISVRDTGVGIKKENYEKIFDRFFREDQARPRTGYGLGLSISREIANLHGGRIEVKSVLGRGSTFTLVMPSYN